MSDTDEVIRRFNDAFVDHSPGQLDGLIGEECVMEAIQPAPTIHIAVRRDGGQ